MQTQYWDKSICHPYMLASDYYPASIDFGDPQTVICSAYTLGLGLVGAACQCHVDVILY